MNAHVRVANRSPLVTPEHTVGAAWRPAVRGCAIVVAHALFIAAILYLLLGAWHRDIHVPLTFSSDSLWYLMQSKSTVQGGWWWSNQHLGAPFVLDELAYPSNSNVDQAVVWAISRLVPDALAAVNVTWALLVVVSGITATWCMRALGLSTPSAVAGGTLFALSPYALYRNIDHFALMVYLVPFACTVALWLASGLAHREWRRRTAIGLFAGCVLLAFNYVYYAFFACFCIAAGAGIGYLAHRRRQLLISGLVCITVIAGATFVNLAPSLESWRRHGRPVILQDKTPAEAEMFGMKLRQLVSPVFPNRVGPFQSWVQREATARFPNENENWTARLGLVGTVGFLGLVVMWFMPDPQRSRISPLLRSASKLTLAAVLLATVGGFGALFSLLVSSDIRGYNRIFPFIDFFSLVAVAIALDTLLKTQRSRTIAAAVVVVVGVADQGQALERFNERYTTIAAEIASLHALVDPLERALPNDAMVFQLPLRPYMNESDFGAMKQFDHFKPYLVSDSLRFSYPAFANEQVRWQQDVSRLDPQSLVTYLTVQNFSAILVDRYGYEDNGAEITSALEHVLGSGQVIAQTQRYIALTLAAVRSRPADHLLDSGKQVPATLSMHPCDGQTLFTIEQIATTHAPFAEAEVDVPRSTELKVWGWAVDHRHRALAGGVDLVVDRTVFPSTYGLNRNDVADYFHRTGYRASGFVAQVPAGALMPGKHWIGLRVTSTDGSCYYQTSGVFVTVQ